MPLPLLLVRACSHSAFVFLQQPDSPAYSGALNPADFSSTGPQMTGASDPSANPTLTQPTSRLQHHVAGIHRGALQRYQLLRLYEHPDTETMAPSLSDGEEADSNSVRAMCAGYNGAYSGAQGLSNLGPASGATMNGGYQTSLGGPASYNTLSGAFGQL